MNENYEKKDDWDFADNRSFTQSSYSNAQGHQPQQQGGDSTGGIIPYKNPKALISYYLGIFSILPVVGILTGIAAVVLGILGIMDRNKNPIIKGTAHAVIGIACGSIGFLVWLAAVILFVGAAAYQPQ